MTAIHEIPPANRGILPAPRRLRVGAERVFRLERAGLRVDGEPSLGGPVAVLRDALGREHGIIVSPKAERAIAVELRREAPQGEESFEIEINRLGVWIRAREWRGACRGMQAFLQMAACQAEIDADARGIWLPACHIEDEPALAWRGMHLDVARHFFPIDRVKRLVDLLAAHRMNVLQFHLTDDQGWRVESRRFPRLTGIGSRREESPKRGDRTAGDGKPYGGFYTQADLQELVAYAACRGIDVVPEIDVPGHAAALLAAHPELGCDDLADYQPRVETRWGIFPWVLAPKPATFAFFESLFDELAGIFPARYFHIGGDEVIETQWEQSPMVRDFLASHPLAAERGLPAYFVTKMAGILRQLGRRTIGWDETLDAGPDDAVVMVWRNWEAARRALAQGREVILAPKSHTYFDYYQGNRATEPEAIGGFLPIETVAAMNPLAAGEPDQERLVLGVQGQLWSEYLPDWSDVEYMALPRMAALAEVGWAGRPVRDWDGFRSSLVRHLQRLDRLGHRFRRLDREVDRAMAAAALPAPVSQ